MSYAELRAIAALRAQGLGGFARMQMLIASIVIAATGGAVQWVRHAKKDFSLFAFLTAILTSAFVGMQTHFLMQYLDFPESLRYSVVGVAGYGSGTLLDAVVPLLVRWAYKRLGLAYPTPRRRAEDYTEEASVSDES